MVKTLLATRRILARELHAMQRHLSLTQGRWTSRDLVRVTYDVEVILGVCWVLLQEASDKPVGVLSCVSVIGDIVTVRF